MTTKNDNYASRKAQATYDYDQDRRQRQLRQPPPTEEEKQAMHAKWKADIAAINKEQQDGATAEKNKEKGADTAEQKPAAEVEKKTAPVPNRTPPPIQQQGAASYSGRSVGSWKKSF